MASDSGRVRRLAERGAINVGDIQMNLGTCRNFGVILEKPNFIDSMIALPTPVRTCCAANYNGRRADTL